MDRPEHSGYPTSNGRTTTYGSLEPGAWSNGHDNGLPHTSDIGLMEKDSQLGSAGNVNEERLFTVQEAIDHIGFKWFQIKLSIVTGLAWMTEAMELSLLAILGPVLRCEWDILPWQEALLSTLVLVGMMLGSIVWGISADMCGRKPVLTLNCMLVAYFGMLTAVSPNYAWVAFNRFMVGFFCGGLPQCLTLYSEYLPTKNRSTCVMTNEIFYSVGAALVVLLAMLVIPTLGWRYLLVFSAIPVSVLPLTSLWLPESARFMTNNNRYDEAVAMIDRIARDNGKKTLPGRLKPMEKKDRVSTNRFYDLFAKSRVRTFIFLNTTWFLLGFSYFGIALLAPTLFSNPDGCHGYGATIVLTRKQCSAHCVPFTDKDYIDLIYTSLADTPGIIVATILMMFVGRKATIMLCLAAYSLFLYVSTICLPRPLLTAFLGISRGGVSGAYQAGYVYTSEVYPTHIRAIGMGFGSAVARVGGFITPYVAQVLTNYNSFMSILVYAVMGTISAITTFLMPIETKGRAMKDSEDNVINVDEQTKGSSPDIEH